MSRHSPPSSLPSIPTVVTMAVLAGALGAFVGGLRGLLAGGGAGIVLALLPFVAGRMRFWLMKKDGLPHLVAHETATVVLTAAAPPVDAVGRLFAAVARVLRGPALMARLAVSVVANMAATWLGAAAKALATPLGMANVAAAAILIAAAAQVQAASIAVIAGLPAMILVLLVAEYESETAHGDSGRRPKRRR